MSPFDELLWEARRLNIFLPEGVSDREAANLVLADLRIDVSQPRSRDDLRSIADLETAELVDHAIRVAEFTTFDQRLNAINDRSFKGLK